MPVTRRNARAHRNRASGPSATSSPAPDRRSGELQSHQNNPPSGAASRRRAIATRALRRESASLRDNPSPSHAITSGEEARQELLQMIRDEVQALAQTFQPATNLQSPPPTSEPTPRSDAPISATIPLQPTAGL